MGKISIPGGGCHRKVKGRNEKKDKLDLSIRNRNGGEKFHEQTDG